jgi:hypothetical protein
MDPTEEEVFISGIEGDKDDFGVCKNLSEI